MATSAERYSASFLTQLYQLLDAALDIDGATFGNVQIYDRQSDSLEILAHRGFDEAFIEGFKYVKTSGASVCARAFRLANRVDIPDISVDSFFIPLLDTPPEICFKAMQATPVLNKHGVVIGILSTYFSRTHRLSDGAKVALNDLADHIAVLMEKNISGLQSTY